MKTIIYQVLPRYWGNAGGACRKNGGLSVNGCGTFDDFDMPSLEYIKWLGCSHIWFTGVVAHAMQPLTEEDKAGKTRPVLKRFAAAAADARDGRKAEDFVKGRAGSPYAISNYYDTAPYLGTPADFRKLVKRVHKAGLKCVIDFIPNHVAANYADGNGGIPDCGCCDYDWTDTLKINYNAPETWEKMYDIMRYWARQGVDGFRCDMVELVCPDFFGWLFGRIREEFPDMLFIAEVYDKGNYRRYIDEARFDLLYDKSGLYDNLHALVCREAALPENDPAAHWASARSISRNWQELGDLQSHMVNFLENHDEKRIASPAFAGRASRGLAALAVSAAFNDGAFMLYSGQEVGEKGIDDAGMSGGDGRSTIYDWWTPEFANKLNAMIQSESYKSLSINEIVSNSNDTVSVRDAELFCRYAMLLRSLNCAASERKGSVSGAASVSDERSYDLCWCQRELDADRMFAFLRGARLFVCNFSPAKRRLHIVIPESAGDFFGRRFPEEVAVTVPAFDFSVVDL